MTDRDAISFWHSSLSSPGMDLIIEGCEIFPVTARRAVERQTQYDADDPKPAPTGKDVFTTTENEGTLEKRIII